MNRLRITRNSIAMRTFQKRAAHWLIHIYRRRNPGAGPLWEILLVLGYLALPSKRADGWRCARVLQVRWW